MHLPRVHRFGNELIPFRWPVQIKFVPFCLSVCFVLLLGFYFLRIYLIMTVFERFMINSSCWLNRIYFFFVHCLLITLFYLSKKKMYFFFIFYLIILMIGPPPLTLFSFYHLSFSKIRSPPLCVSELSANERMKKSEKYKENNVNFEIVIGSLVNNSF